MIRDSFAIIAINTPDGDRRAHHVLGHVARHTLRLRRDVPLLHIGHQAVGILPETPIDQLRDRLGPQRLTEHRQQMPLPLTTQQLVGQIRQMFPALSQTIIAPTGGDQVQMGVVTTTVTIP